MLTSALMALALFAAPDAAAGAETPAAAPSQPAPQAKPKKTCVKEPEVSGTRLSRKVCVTEKPKAAAKPAETPPADKPAG